MEGKIYTAKGNYGGRISPLVVITACHGKWLVVS